MNVSVYSLNHLCDENFHLTFLKDNLICTLIKTASNKILKSNYSSKAIFVETINSFYDNMCFFLKKKLAIQVDLNLKDNLQVLPSKKSRVTRNRKLSCA